MVDVDFRARLAFHLSADPMAIVGEADEPEFATDISGDHAIELVYEAGGIFLPPLHADDLFHQTPVSI
jgi:hypothetical protein